MTKDYGRRRPPGRDRSNDDDRTQIIPTSHGDLPTNVFQRPGHTSIIPKTAQEEVDQMIDEVAAETFRNKRNRIERSGQPPRPGIIARVFGYALAIMFAVFCAFIIGITFAFILWKYYSHLFH